MATVTVMFGPSGSGKSSWLAKNRPDAVVCSSDDWFMHNGTYQWSSSQMDQAHQTCMRKFLEHLMLEDPPDLAVDNAFTTVLSANPYIQAALAMGFKVEVVIMVPKEGWTLESIQKAHSRNQHNVPLHTVSSSAERINRLFDNWASFLPEPTIVHPKF